MSGFQFSIYKNGTLLKTIQPTSIGQSFATTFYATKNPGATGSIYEYEIYLGTMYCETDIESSDPATFEIYFECDISCSYERERTVYNGVTTNCDVTTYTYNSYIVSINNTFSPTYVSPSYALGKTKDVSTLTGFVFGNDLNFNTASINLADVKTANINWANINTANVKSLIVDGYVQSMQLTAGYLINRPNGGRRIPIPIICSVRYLNPDDSDDAYIINPGYEFLCYEGDNYVGNFVQFNNSNGTTPQQFVKTLVNVTSSIKVYYKGTEITYPYLSYA